METTLGNILKILTLLVVAHFKWVATSPTWYSANDGNEYLIEADNKYNWLQASDECARRNLQLVIIENSAKNAAFDVLLRKIFAKSPNLWIGYHDEFSSAKDTSRPFYAISTGQKFSFSNWKSGEPNNQGNSEHCTHVFSDSDYKWNDQRCDSKYGYACEKHYLTTKSVEGLQEKRQTANVLNTNLLSDYRIKKTEIEQILETTRTTTDKVVVDLSYNTNDIIAKSRSSIDDIVKTKPYLQAVIADVGESIGAIVRETLKEISEISQEARQTIENIHVSAEGSISGITSEFEEKLENNKNAIDKLFV